MMVLMMSFAAIGAGPFSIDRVLRDKGWWPERFHIFASG